MGSGYYLTQILKTQIDVIGKNIDHNSKRREENLQQKVELEKTHLGHEENALNLKKKAINESIERN